MEIHRQKLNADANARKALISRLTTCDAFSYRCSLACDLADVTDITTDSRTSSIMLVIQQLHHKAQRRITVNKVHDTDTRNAPVT